MVIVKLMGGLGNQMFQFATGYATSKRLNTQLFLDLSWFSQSMHDTSITPRKFELDKFELEYFVIEGNVLMEKNDRKRNKFIRYMDNILGRDIHRIVENTIEYTPIICKKNENIYLEGYWQSFKYFKDYEQDIKYFFLKSSDHFNEFNKTIALGIQQQNSIALHIRRGDYVTNHHANSFHGLISIDYYYDAIEYLTNNDYINQDSKVFIFSDDIDWVKQNFKVDYSTHYVNHNSLEQAHYDIILMSLCQHHILANSSFSWWGGYLSKSEGITIAPRSWYVGSSNDTSFMFPDAWIRL